MKTALRTINHQPPTPNTGLATALGHWMLDVRCWLFEVSLISRVLRALGAVYFPLPK